MMNSDVNSIRMVGPFREDRLAEELKREQRLVGRRALYEQIFAWLCRILMWCALGVLALLLVQTIASGAKWLSWDFLTQFASRMPERSGIIAALVGTLSLVGLTAAMAIPLGIAAAVYLEELIPDRKSKRFIDTNINNLASVPSIVYGILGLAVFVRFFGFDRSLLAASCTLSLLILPVIIISSREALRSIPASIRSAALAMGATPWQVTRDHVLPAALPSMLTGTILGLSRAIGESAPLIMIGGMAYVRHLPNSIFDSFTALPIQIYSWAAKPDESFRELAAAAILVLLAVLFVLNFAAILLRNYYRSKNTWQHL